MSFFHTDSASQLSVSRLLLCVFDFNLYMCFYTSIWTVFRAALPTLFDLLLMLHWCFLHSCISLRCQRWTSMWGVMEAGCCLSPQSFTLTCSLKNWREFELPTTAAATMELAMTGITHVHETISNSYPVLFGCQILTQVLSNWHNQPNIWKALH